jgi:hypothetical protein
MAAAGPAGVRKTGLEINQLPCQPWLWPDFEGIGLGGTMTIRARIATIWLTLSFAMFCGGAFAEDCTTLRQLASIQLVKAKDSDVMLVPVSINNHDRYLVLDTGGVTTQLTQSTAKDFDLRS